MRSFVAFCLGVVATIGIAYFHDVSTSRDQKLVNWDQAGKVSRDMVDVARKQINRLTEK